MRPRTFRYPAYAALAAALATTGCTSLKLSSLHDARILPAGGMAVSAELATAASVERAIVVSARGDTVLDGIRADGEYRHADGGAIPMVGANFARGLGNGWEFNAGGDLALLGIGSLVLDAGIKKRVYENPRLLLTAYARGAIGSAPNNVSWDTGAGDDRVFTLEAQTFELDAQALALVRIWPRLSFYLNAGPSVGNAKYDLDERDGGLEFGNDVGFYGAKTHLGLVLETKRFELAGEIGNHFMSYGYAPSLGVRATVKSGWLR